MQSGLKMVYDRRTAAWLVKGSAAVYGGEAAMASWAQSFGGVLREVVRDGGTDTVAMAAEGQEEVVVVFRGTADLRNWLTDMDCKQVSWKLEGRAWMDGLRVHEGFQRALGSVWSGLKGWVDRLTGSGGKRVWFTGHSLGGALAMLAASGAGPQGWVYTFGQPRVGNGAWARWYDARLRGQTFRVVHGDDVVARVPWMLGGYRHGGTEVFYAGRMKAEGGRMKAEGRRTKEGETAENLFSDAQKAGLGGGMMTEREIRGSQRSPLSREELEIMIDAPWWRKLGSGWRGVWREMAAGRLALLADHHVSTYVGMLEGEWK